MLYHFYIFPCPSTSFHIFNLIAQLSFKTHFIFPSNVSLKNIKMNCEYKSDNDSEKEIIKLYLCIAFARLPSSLFISI